MIRALRSLSAITFSCVCFVATSVRAEVDITLALSDLNEGAGASELQVNGQAALSAGGIRLTKNVGTQVGSAFYKQPVTMSAHRSFSAYFTFRMTNPQCKGIVDGGADGIAFVIAPEGAALGRGGGGLGYQGLASTVAIEFDTHYNPGPQELEKNHVAININGEEVSVASAEVPLKLNNGQIYHAWVDYDGKDDTLQVRVGSTNARPAEPLLSRKVDLEKVVGSEAFVGFSASTGTCLQQHDVFSLYFNADNLLEGIDTSIENYRTAGQ